MLRKLLPTTMLSDRALDEPDEWCYCSQRLHLPLLCHNMAACRIFWAEEEDDDDSWASESVSNLWMPQVQAQASVLRQRRRLDYVSLPLKLSTSVSCQVRPAFLACVFVSCCTTHPRPYSAYYDDRCLLFRLCRSPDHWHTPT